MSDPDKRTAYFDTNVFDHIYKRDGITDKQVEQLHSCVRTSKLSIVFSYINLEEILSALYKSGEALKIARDELRLILDLCDHSKFIISQDDVVKEAIRAYALGSPPPSPFISLPRNAKRVLEATIRRSTIPTDIHHIIKNAQRDKNEFLVVRSQRKELALASLREKGIRPNPAEYPLADFLQANELSMAEDFAERTGVLEQCRIRGIKGLLDLRGIGLVVRASLALWYAQTFQDRKPDPGDSRDMLQTILASTADTFVTDDGRLKKLLNSFPSTGLEIVNLPMFAASIT
jgi:predicted nucleic-acid-binding protein